MRDEKRIDRILKLIKERWEIYPDSRFFQLLINLGLVPDNNFLWHLEDDDLEHYLIINTKNVKDVKDVKDVNTMEVK
jgi:hypothetical protein